MTAKEEILQKIRSAVSTSAPASDYSSIPRDYPQRGTLDEAGRLRLFEDRLLDYDAVVYQCSKPEIRQTIQKAAANRGKHSLVIPEEFPREHRPDSLQFRTDALLSYGELDRSEGVLTGCALAIAVTGTIVLRHSRSEGRRALTLIPDYHLCIVYTAQIVETVVEGVRQMAAFGNFPLTTISGPSATSDIEMTRVKGVHGPRFLDVILVVSE